MPLWQKVQQKPRDTDSVPVKAEDEAPNMSTVDKLDVAAAKAPLWSAKHMEEKPTMWQQVRAGQRAPFPVLLPPRLCAVRERPSSPPA